MSNLEKQQKEDELRLKIQQAMEKERLEREELERKYTMSIAAEEEEE